MTTSTSKDSDDRRLILSVSILRGIRELGDRIRHLEAARDELIRLHDPEKRPEVTS
jgi:hypothetical protein